MKLVVVKFLKNSRFAEIVERFPGKYTIDVTLLGKLGGGTVVLMATIYGLFSGVDDTSHLGTSHVQLGERFKAKDNPATATKKLKGIGELTPQSEKIESHAIAVRRKIGPQNIKYKAPQVLVRKGISGMGNQLPVGANFIGRLVSSIDTRWPSKTIKIELPYGGAYRGNKLLPNYSHVFASAKYSGNGEIIFLDIHSGVYPDGRRFKIKAQALNAKSFAPGLQGEFHGTLGGRVASTLGLSFISSVTDIVQDKEVLGNTQIPTPKSSLKNGLLNGISAVTEIEAQRQAEEFRSKKPYVTISSGRELIINLTEAFLPGD